MEDGCDKPIGVSSKTLVPEIMTAQEKQFGYYRGNEMFSPVFVWGENLLLHLNNLIINFYNICLVNVIIKQFN